jgi:hypothetical protein
VFLFTGGAAVSLGRNPHGVAFFLSQKLNQLRSRASGDADLKPDVEEVTPVATAAG